MMEDLSNWPLVTCVHRKQQTFDDYVAQLDRWQDWLMREEPFALLRVYATSESLSPPDGGAAAGKAWLARNRPMLQRWVIGMATVILPPQEYARMRNLKVEKAFGVPGGVFASVGEGVAWLQREVLVPRGIHVEPRLAHPC